jgi:hypothetical protein
MAFPLLALVALGGLVLLVAKGGGKAASTQRPRPILPGKSGCYDVPAYGGAGRDLSDIPPTQRFAFEEALTKSTDIVGLEGLATTLDCIGYSLAAKRFRLRAAQLRAGGRGGFPGDGRTVPPVVGPSAYVPGCVPPIGWAAPPGWSLGMALAPDPGRWPGMPEGYSLGTPLPAGSPCPSGWDDARLGDAGVDGLPDPLKSAVRKAIATGTDAAMLEELAKHLDAMGQSKAAFAVRAKAASVGCPTIAQIDTIAAQIGLGTMSVEDAKKMDADLSARCALPFAWAKVRMAIAEKSPGYVSPSGESSEPGEIPLGSLGPVPSLFDPCIALILGLPEMSVDNSKAIQSIALESYKTGTKETRAFVAKTIEIDGLARQKIWADAGKYDEAKEIKLTYDNAVKCLGGTSGATTSAVKTTADYKAGVADGAAFCESWHADGKDSFGKSLPPKVTGGSEDYQQGFYDGKGACETKYAKGAPGL